MKYYAGIGSRKTPADILALMTRVATRLETHGYHLNSGGAVGADTAFAAGCSNKTVFIPWSSFGDGVVACDAQAMAIAAKFHPAWNKLSQGARKLMARNVHQILGADLHTPVQFVICWTPDGAETCTTIKTGGTGQAIRVAIEYQIPVFNLSNGDALERIAEFLNN